MMPEEVRGFVKNRFEYQLKNSGLEDVSKYMNRFDTLYGQGKMDNLMPTTNQRHITEDIPFMEWDKPFAKIEELEEQNYNMIDNVLNNGAGEKEQKRSNAKMSVTEKLAAKKAAIEQRGKDIKPAPEKGADRKSEREI
jgi:hypothetical protein